MSVKCYHSTLRDIAERRRSHQQRARSLKPRKYNSTDQIQLGGLGEACVAHGGHRNECRFLMGNSEEKTLL
jgi:hypothetical protein